MAGIIGMTPAPDQFNIVGVAPEAKLYMYRAFGCDSKGGSDAILAGMLKAQSDGVDIVSMSLSVGSPSPYANTNEDPLAEVTKKLTDAGIAVSKYSLRHFTLWMRRELMRTVVAASNSANGNKNANNLYTSAWPSVEPSTISVGASKLSQKLDGFLSYKPLVANKEFPLVYSTTDSQGSVLQYASVFPLDTSSSLDVYIIEDGCNTNDWETAIDTVQNPNTTIFAFQVLGASGCVTNYIGNYNGARYAPKYIMAFSAEVKDLYSMRYSVPNPGFFSGQPQFVNLGAKDGATFAANYETAGMY